MPDLDLPLASTQLARTTPASDTNQPLSESAARLLGVLGVAGVAFVHILDANSTFQDTRYVFWLYMVLIAGAIPVAGALIYGRSQLAWRASAALALVPLVGYIISRSVGLPGDPGDVGNWLDTLGMVSIFIETSLLALSLSRLMTIRATRSTPNAASGNGRAHVVEQRRARRLGPG